MYSIKFGFFPFNNIFISIYKYFTIKELEFLLIVANSIFIISLFFKFSNLITLSFISYPIYIFLIVNLIITTQNIIYKNNIFFLLINTTIINSNLICLFIFILGTENCNTIIIVNLLIYIAIYFLILKFFFIFIKILLNNNLYTINFKLIIKFNKVILILLINFPSFIFFL